MRLLLIAIICFFPALLQAKSWQVDYDKSTLGFRATWSGDVVEGQFKQFNADIIFDPHALSTGPVGVVVDLSSVSTEDKERDGEIRGADWFAVKHFPQATFLSSEVIPNGKAGYIMRGALTIRDVTHDIEFPFNITINEGKAVADAAFTLNRLDFGIGQGEWQSEKYVGDTVTVFFHLVATAK
jgi:polyisoprenoid-binding protein YceI